MAVTGCPGKSGTPWSQGCPDTELDSLVTGSHSDMDLDSLNTNCLADTELASLVINCPSNRELDSLVIGCLSGTELVTLMGQTKFQSTSPISELLFMCQFMVPHYLYSFILLPVTTRKAVIFPNVVSSCDLFP